MTTYIIYSDPADGYIRSTNDNYATAQAGSNLVVDTSDTKIMTGLNYLGSTKYIYQGFLSFDTSVITDTDEIVDATITQYSGYDRNQSAAWGQQFRSYDWGTTLSASAWRTQAQLAALPLVANFDYLFSSTPFTWRATGRNTLRSAINKTGVMKFVVCNNWSAEGVGFSASVLENWIYSGNSTNKPYLTVYTTQLNTLNSVALATTTLSDGTSISLRSDGGALTPVISIGYTPLNGTWTSIGTISSAFAINIDGLNSFSMTSDPSGNFYLFGTTFNNGNSVTGQAWVRTGTTTWTAKSPLSQAIPQGDEQDVISTAITYVAGGSDGNDKPCIMALASRASGGNRPSFPNHISGSGYTHGVTLNVPNLLAGSGPLLYNSYNGSWYLTETGVPSFVDLISMGPNLVVGYSQRGKIGSNTLGGLCVYNMYAGDYISVRGFNMEYIPTGAAKLVPISPVVFAHVFDNNGEKLSIRFYNSVAQVIGETSIPSSSFYGGSIGTKWAVYFDKTANLLRVYYVAAASSTTLDRFDVSPVTYVGTLTQAVTTTYGPSGSNNLIVRVDPKADERAVHITSANISSAGALSTQVFMSNVGNVAPNAPALTTRSNFDATSPATFAWTPGDANASDYQTKYDLEISRVSDSVVVYAPTTVVSKISSASVPASTLVNGTNYRWRVRTYDVIGTAGAWSGYGTFTTAATGTLTITAPSADNQTGIDTSSYTVTWNYVQSGGQTQAQRQVRVIRTSDSAVISDTTMQANTTPSYTISGLESGKEYRIEVSIVNTASITTPVITRLITPNYSQPMTPTLDITPKDSYIQITVVNPTPSGNRPEVIYNDIYKRVSKAGAVASDFKRIAIINNAATYRDYAIKSGASYDYYVVGRTT